MKSLSTGSSYRAGAPSRRAILRLSLSAMFLLTLFGVAEAQYRQPYGEAYATTPYAQQLDSAAKEALRDGLIFDYGEYRRKAHVGLILSCVGVSCAVVDGFLQTEPLLFSGIAAACVGIPMLAANVVRKNRTRRHYFYTMRRPLEADYEKWRQWLSL